MRINKAAAAAISAPLFAVAALAAVVGAIAAPDRDTSICSLNRDPGGGASTAADLSPAQLGNAQIIAEVGVRMSVPMPGEMIAIATALQESTLQNLDHGDRDSLGLFQQRPSQGWGTPAQIMNPVYAAQQFYKQLLQIPGWRSMRTTDAAQAVQRSGYPEAYEKWAGEAATLAAEFTGAAADGSGLACTPLDSSGNTTTAAAVNAAGYRIPPGTPAATAAVITFALAQLGKPYAYGATGPNAYDCSGLVQAAYARIGIRLPRTTFDQVNTGRTVYNTTQLQPGDLLFIPGSDGTPPPPAASACTSATDSSHKPPQKKPATTSNSAH